MSQRRTNATVAYAAKRKIEDYWRENGKEFHSPTVTIGVNHEIESNIVNGYPPLLPSIGRGR